MALNTAALKTAIKAAMASAMEASENSEASPATVQDNFAEAMANAIEAFVKTMQITIASGQINTTGTAAAQSNPAPVVISNTPPNIIE